MMVQIRKAMLSKLVEEQPEEEKTPEEKPKGLMAEKVNKMAFNWKAFAASFLEKQTEGIRERQEAKEFEEEQEELAKQNRRLIAERTNLANSYGQLGQRAMALGATKRAGHSCYGIWSTGYTNIL